MTRLPAPTSKRPRRRWLRSATLAIVLTTPALLASACDSGGDAGGAPPGSLEVVFATSPEKLTYLQDLASAFNADKVEVDGKPVFITVQKTSSGIGADLLVDDWPETAEQHRPVIWSPSASLWGEVVNERRISAGKEPVVPAEFEPIMLTPVVIEMPEPMADALGWPSAQIGWADVVALAQNPEGWAALGHPEWGPFRLGKTNPNISTTGFNTTIAQAYAGAGKQRDLTAADLASEQVQVFLEGVESSVVHYGDTTLTFLSNLKRADDRGAATAYVSAVAVEEKSVIDYNRGDPEGKLQPGQTGEEPKTPLVAVYPKEGTLWSDNPFYVLDADWVTNAQKEGARLFGEYVIDKESSQKRALEFGFRPADPNVALAPPIDAENGVLPDQPQTILPVPPGAVLTDVLATWDKIRKAAKVLLVLDVSGSMGESAGSGRETKLELAKQAVTASLDLLADRDEVGLWIFSTELDGTVDYEELAPIEPIGENRDRLKQLVNGLVPLNGTGLYDTTEAAVEYLEPLATPDRITAVVLLTDGKNEDETNDDLPALVEAIGGEGRLGPVRIFAIAYGADASVGELTAIVEAANGAIYTSQDPRQIEQVFENVISNF